MAQEALQRLREEWAQQQAQEAEKRAESERLRQEQEAKDRAAREEMERLMETLRLEKEEQKREEERKREEEQKRTAAEEKARREIDEEVQRNLSERLKAEIERLQSDLRRHTQGARPDLTSGRALTQQARSEASFGHQEQLDWDPTWKFPPSNPFSSRSRRRALHGHHHHQHHQQPEPRFIEDAVRSPSVRSPSLAAEDDPFGDAERHSSSSHWTYNQPARAPSYAGAPVGQQTPRFRSSASTPVPLRASVYRDEVDSVYEGDEAAPESDSQNPWHQGGVGRRARSDGTGQSNPAGSQADVRPASAYVGGGGAEGYSMGAAGQYLTKGYVSDAEAKSGFRVSQYRHHVDGRAAATPRPRKTHAANGAVDPPPVPTPPTETPPHAPRRGQSSQATPAASSSGGRRFSESARPSFEGFPPPPSTAPASEAASQSTPQLIQYLPLDQASAMAAFKNVPVIMMPVVPLYSLQFGQIPGQDDGTTDGGREILRGGMRSWRIRT